MNPKDWRTIDIEDVSFDATELRNQLVPMLSGDAMAGLGTPDSWAAELIAGCKAGLAKVWPFAGPEREFLDRLLDEGDLRPKLITDDDELAERIAKHPGLLWKAHNVREHRGKRPT
jgi:hypothetical protein